MNRLPMPVACFRCCLLAACSVTEDNKDRRTVSIDENRIAAGADVARE